MVFVQFRYVRAMHIVSMRVCFLYSVSENGFLGFRLIDLVFCLICREFILL